MKTFLTWFAGMRRKIGPLARPAGVRPWVWQSLMWLFIIITTVLTSNPLWVCTLEQWRRD